MYREEFKVWTYYFFCTFFLMFCLLFHVFECLLSSLIALYQLNSVFGIVCTFYFSWKWALQTSDYFLVLKTSMSPKVFVYRIFFVSRLVHFTCRSDFSTLIQVLRSGQGNRSIVTTIAFLIPFVIKYVSGKNKLFQFCPVNSKNFSI